MSDSRELLDTRNDPYAAYGAKVGTSGQYLSFKNGEYLFGQEGEELPLGTKLFANMPGLLVGWRRWFNAQITDDRTHLLTECRTIESRNELGDTDQALWEKPKPTAQNPNPAPQDPWQFTNILELSSGEETYIFSSSSKGGIGAIGRLCKEYGKERRQRPGMLPIIELSRDFYNHKTYGKTYFPEFKIVGWTDEDRPSLEGEEDEIPFDPPKQAVKQEPKRTRF